MACMFGFHSINRGLLGLLPEGTMSSGTRDCLSALFVGVEASLLLAPLELVRIQGQNRAKGGLLSATRYVLQTIGPLGLLTRGMHACMQREAKYCLGQFAAIGAVTSGLGEWAAANANAGPSGGSAVARRLQDQDVRTAVASVAVGVLCTVVSHPDDVVKTRQQTRITSAGRFEASMGATGVTAAVGASPPLKDPYRSYAGAMRFVYASEGKLALFKGSMWRCFVRVPLGLTVINWVHPRIRPLVEDLVGAQGGRSESGRSKKTES